VKDAVLIWLEQFRVNIQ